MVMRTVGVSVPPGTTATFAFQGGGKSKVATTLPDIAAGFEVVAFCARCESPADTGWHVRLEDLPLARSGQWRHSCGGPAFLTDEYEIIDQRTGRTIDVYVAAREQIQASAVTAAELLRLSQAARALQANRPGADERFDRVLAAAPEPIRRLRDRIALVGWTREQKMMLAGIIVALAVGLIPLLKDDGAVSEQQLTETIERLTSELSDAPAEQGKAEEKAAGGAGSAGASEGGRPADPLDSGRDGRPPKVKHQQGVDDPD